MMFVISGIMELFFHMVFDRSQVKKFETSSPILACPYQECRIGIHCRYLGM